MAYFSTSSPGGESKGWPELEHLRYRGHRGGEIRMHRGLIRFRVRGVNLFHAALLSVGVTMLWVRFLPAVCNFWYFLFKYLTAALDIEATVSMVPQNLSKFIHLSLPFVSVQPGRISPLTWTLTLFLTLAAFAASYALGDEQAPWAYILRALVFVQASALVYFAVASAHFPHDIATYTEGMLTFGIILIGMIPLALAFTYYLFDFAFWKKLAVTVLLMAHLTLFFPLQYALQVCILHHSMLFMPLLYFAFGPFLDVLIFVCFYSWAMSWASSPTQTCA